MGTEILINVTAKQTRIAVVNASVLQEIYIENENQNLVGNIYKGQVVRVLPGMQAAFVDFGSERRGFLHERDLASSFKSLKEGQELLVQVTKEPIDAKGARLTTKLSIATRALVYMPMQEGILFSTKITDLAEQERLRNLLTTSTGGFLIRTQAQHNLSLEADQRYLEKEWQRIKECAKLAKLGELVYGEINLALRTLRDLVSNNVAVIRIDSEQLYNECVLFIQESIPNFKGNIELYAQKPIFDLYNINDEINRALDSKVMLPSGGYLYIEHTHAMTTIDVNTGAYVGSNNLEETVYKTNLEAVSAICRQLRLRNLGGIIIIDFIDMQNDLHKDKVMQALQAELLLDRIKTTCNGPTHLGLVEVTRKRTRASLMQSLCEPCQTCMGRGFVSSIDTIVGEILREVLRFVHLSNSKNILIIAAPVIVDAIEEKYVDFVSQLEQDHHKNIQLQSDVLFTTQQYDVVLL